MGGFLSVGPNFLKILKIFFFVYIRRNSPNLRVYPSDVTMQETLHQLRSAEWKMMSKFSKIKKKSFKKVKLVAQWLFIWALH